MTTIPTGNITWDERYGQTDFYYGTSPNDFLAATFTRIPGERVLCLAEGEGRNAVFLAGHGYQVTAVDSSAVGLQKARRLAETVHVRIETICSDLAEYAIEAEQWDGIVSCYCHLPSILRRSLNRQIVTGLKPGGVLILEGFSTAQLDYGTGGPPSSDMLFVLEELQNELEGLDFIHAVMIERDVREGRGHTGLASVVQILAVKPAAV